MRAEAEQAQTALEHRETDQGADEQREQDVDEAHHGSTLRQLTMAVTESPSCRRLNFVSAIFFFADASTTKLFMKSRSMPERLNVLKA